MSINLNEIEYQKVLADIESDLESVLKSEQEALRKDFPPGDDESASAAPEASAGGEGSDSAPAEGSESAPPDASASPDASAGAPPDASASPGAPAGDPAMGGGEDLETKLMGLPEEQLRHLYMACKQALFARMSQAGAPGAGAGAPPDASASAGGPPGAPPMGAPAPGAGGPPGMPPPDASASAGGPPMAPPAGAPPMPPPAMKSDAGLGLMKPKSTAAGMDSNKANGGPGPGAVKLGKNEEHTMKEQDEKKIADLEQKVELMAKALNLALGQPMRKAITGTSYVPKNDGGTDTEKPKLSKTQVTEKLKSLDQAKLTKSDRAAINSYYNKFEVDQIAHLLK